METIVFDGTPHEASGVTSDEVPSYQRAVTRIWAVSPMAASRTS